MAQQPEKAQRWEETMTLRWRQMANHFGAALVRDAKWAHDVVEKHMTKLESKSRDPTALTAAMFALASESAEKAPATSVEGVGEEQEEEEEDALDEGEEEEEEEEESEV